MTPSTAPTPPTAAQRLERLKVIVKHLGDTWPHVLRRQLCLQTLGCHEDLHAALSQTYAAHVTNMLQDVLVIDLLRELGALVLDSDSRAASVRRALIALKDSEVIAGLRREYEIVPPLGHIGGDPIAPTMRAEIDRQWEATERRDRLATFDQLLNTELPIDEELLGSEVGNKLWQARSKGVAHYDVVRAGDDWNLWQVEGTGLTWGQINDYVYTCTKAIDTLLLLVKQASFDFDESKRISQKDVDEFIAALVIGLREQRRQRDERQDRLMRGFDDGDDDDD